MASNEAMAAPRFDGHITSFDVVVEHSIGTVRIDGNGHRSPMEAAMILLSDHQGGDCEGAVYRFPAPNGGECRIAITYTEEGE